MAAFAPPTVSDCMRHRGSTAARKGLQAMAFAFALLSCGANAGDNVTRAIEDASFDDVRIALVDAIADEGIGATTESRFGEMLTRTAPDLGHRPDLFAEARIYTFCSVVVAARLTTESAHNIAQCPLSIAVYQTPDAPRTVYLGYRRNVESEAGHQADALLARIAARTAAQFDRSSR